MKYKMNSHRFVGLLTTVLLTVPLNQTAAFVNPKNKIKTSFNYAQYQQHFNKSAKKNTVFSPSFTNIPKIQTIFNRTNRNMNRQIMNMSALTPVSTTVATLQQLVGGATAKATASKVSKVAVVTAAASSATLTLPPIRALILSCLLPTCIGFYKYEYGVSYAYGAATSLSAYLLLQPLLQLVDVATITSSLNTLPTLALIHAAAIMFYGLRLNSFLLYRELFLDRFRRMRERIEERQISNEGGIDVSKIMRFSQRAPFILSCAALYGGLIAPVYTVSRVVQSTIASSASVIPLWSIKAYQILVSLTWFGYILGALGDYYKSFIKSRKGADHLVTGGLFSIFRHPNYTGEMIAWISSYLGSLITCISFFIASSPPSSSYKSILLKLINDWRQLSASVLFGFFGMMGIVFVLAAATTNLERRQKEKYGDSGEYKSWIKRSWSGFSLKKN